MVYDCSGSRIICSPSYDEHPSKNEGNSQEVPVGEVTIKFRPSRVISPLEHPSRSDQLFNGCSQKNGRTNFFTGANERTIFINHVEPFLSGGMIAA